MSTTDQRGFTLIELVAVIVILGVLAAFALPRFSNLEVSAEKAAVEGFIGALRSAHQLAFTKMMIEAGYKNRTDVSLFGITRCDRNEPTGPYPGGPSWGGHYIGLGGIRTSLFEDPDQMACNGNTITFDTRSGHTITISNTAAGITWTASPLY